MEMKKDNIVEKLKKDFPINLQEVENFAKETIRFLNEKKKGGGLKNEWAKKLPLEAWVQMFKKVANEQLWFDWKHITYGYNGISYDYVAYKNKMLVAYPDSKIDTNLVYEGDEFEFKKANGKITYSHNFTDPFGQTNAKIKGGYAIIKNKRGEFITLLSKADFEQHKKVAKTDYIWNAWYKEMCLKTLVKKAVKVHFDDVFTTMEEEDNKQYDFEKLEKELEKEKEKEMEEKEKELEKKYNITK